MNKKQIEDKTEEILTPIAEEKGCRIYDVEYVKEGKEYFLNCYIDKDSGVTIDDCVEVNRPLSDALDREDFIPGTYTLVVSSPGLTRKLTRDRHLEQSIGKDVEIKLFKAVDGIKEYTGALKSFDRDTYVITLPEGERSFGRKEVSVIRLSPTF